MAGKIFGWDQDMSMDEATLALLEAAARQSVPRYRLPPDESRAGLRAMAKLFAAGSDVVRRELAAASGCAVAMVSYRKAPEHPYPTPIDDAWSAFNWLAMRRKEIFGAELPMVVGGDSAGGNLATVVAMRDKADGAPRLSAQVLLYPVTDSDFETASYLDPDKQALLPREAMQTYWSQYLPDESRRQEPEASPLRAQDLAGMPSSIILTAGYDVLCDEGEAYARRLQEAGVSVAHKRFENQVHAFAMMVGLLPGSAAAISFIAEQLDRFLGADSLGQS